MNIINKICLTIAIFQSVFWSWNLGFMGFFELNEEISGKKIYMIFLSFLFLFFCVLAILYLCLKKFFNTSIILFAINVVLFYFIPNRTVEFEIPTYLILNLFADTYVWYILSFIFYDLLSWFALIWVCLNLVKAIKERKFKVIIKK